MKIIFIVLTVLALNACNRNEKQTTSTETIHIELDPNHLPADSKLSDLVKSVRMIPLETKEESYMNFAVRVFVGQKYILLVSPGGQQFLYLYTVEGKFLRKIGKPGKGPGEYISILDMWVDELAEEVYIREDLAGNMVCFGFSGESMGRIKAISRASESLRIDSKHFAYRTYDDYMVTLFDSDKKDTAYFVSNNSRNRRAIFRFSGSSHSGYFFSAAGIDTIWTVKSDTVYPAISFDFGKGRTDDNELQSRILPGQIRFDGMINCSPDYFNILLERDNSRGKSSSYSVLVNRKTGISSHIHRPDGDDITFITYQLFRAAAVTGEFVAVVDANELIDALPKIIDNEDFQYDKEFIEQIKDLDYEDNPVLLLYEMK